VSNDSVRELRDYSWPGNVRELRNVIERAVIVTSGHVLEVSVPSRIGPKLVPGDTILLNVEADHIRAVLDSTNWCIRGSGGAAERLSASNRRRSRAE